MEKLSQEQIENERILKGILTLLKGKSYSKALRLIDWVKDELAEESTVN